MALTGDARRRAILDELNASDAVRGLERQLTGLYQSLAEVRRMPRSERWTREPWLREYIPHVRRQLAAAIVRRDGLRYDLADRS